MIRSAAMAIRLPVSVLVLPLLLVVGAAPGAAPGVMGDPEMSGEQDGRAPMVVTSDTASYCSALSERINSRAPLPAAVCALRQEGDALCARGDVRTGIRRLRRALVALDAEGGAVPVRGDGTGEDCR